MNRPVGMRVLTICWVTCWLFWVSPKAAAKSTPEQSNFSEGSKAQSISIEIERAELLWKMGRREEALRNLKALLRLRPNDPGLLEALATFEVELGNTGQARRLLKRLTVQQKPSRSVKLLLASCALRESRWSEAREILGPLYREDPTRPEIQRSYAQLLTQERRWEESKKLYEGLRQKRPKDKILLWDYRNVLEQGSPHAAVRYRYFHGPSAERYHAVLQEGGFWISPQWALEAGVKEESFEKGAVGDVDPIKHLLVSQSLEGRFYPAEGVNGSLRWQGTYFAQELWNEGDLAAEVTRQKWRERLEGIVNQLVRDPVEGLEKRGRLDRIRWTQTINPFHRLEFGHELLADWFWVNGDRNSVNGADRLGNKLTNDFSVNWLLWENPHVSLNYHYREGHWNKAFPGAENVLGFISNERVHAGGIYAEYRLTSRTQWIGSVTRGSDVKRRVDFVDWFGEVRFWMKDWLRCNLAYEYDYGDSGTAGSGNSQILTSSITAYF